MPDLWMDVDAALAEVPVNIAALTDDTDFKTREVSIAYDAAGMDLVWNFVTTAGAMTQTAVTPTTGGNYDWAHQGKAMYSIEIPASGGASINNDTEGVGWFTGICTGVLSWRGPTIGFRAAALNNADIDGGDLRDVNVTHIADTAQTGNDVGADVNDILVDTAVIGALGAGLSAIPWNAAWDAEVQSEATDALNAYDPPTNTEMEARTIAAAAYFDPAADTVAHVTLVDTTTTNTDMRGTDSAALASAYTSTRAGYLDELGAANIPADLDAVLADTNELQTDWHDGGRLDLILDNAGAAGTPPTVGEIRAEIDSNSTQLAAIVADTNEVQAELADGGRTDLLIDAILADTNELQTDDYPTSIAAVKGDTAAILIDTADMQPKLGTPAGASMSADTAAVKSDTSAILVDTGTTLDAALAVVDGNVDSILADTADMQPKLGTPAGASISADIAAIEAQTDDIGAAGAGLTGVPWNAAWDAEVQSEVIDALRESIPDSIPADGTIPSVQQALYMIAQYLFDHTITSTTSTIRKVDGSTVLFTLTLNDATSPTAKTRAT